MKIITHLILALLLIAGASSLAKAQNTIPEEKRKLIAEIIAVMKMDKQIVEITDTMLKSMEVTYPIAFRRTLENNPNLTPREREKLGAAVDQSFQAFSKRFRERLPLAVNYSQYIEETVYPLYDKFFTEKELADLVTFYKSETGQKVISTMPQLVAESMQAAQQTLLPKILKLLDEMMQEDFNKLGASSKQAGK
ncbi:MAG TPA: DUF2059 domain-containing protein [Pyrinomonadaceae bacterium]|jgi:hypothetical protein